MHATAGGAFSGKDATKVDRSAAYAARYVAKNIVAAGLADACEVQLAYAIGVAQPVSISINTFDSGKASEEKLIEVVRNNFDLRWPALSKCLICAVQSINKRLLTVTSDVMMLTFRGSVQIRLTSFAKRL